MAGLPNLLRSKVHIGQSKALDLECEISLMALETFDEALRFTEPTEFGVVYYGPME